MAKKSLLVVAIDIGNTNVDVGLFKDGELVAKLTHPTIQPFGSFERAEDFFNSFLDKHPDFKKPNGAILSSVVPGINRLATVLLEHSLNVKPIVLNLAMVKDLKMDIDNPKEVGSDLLAALVAASKEKLYPCVIVDLGTVSKFLMLDKDATFVGASFSPGLRSAFDAMSGTTAMLPKLSETNASIKDGVPPLYGKNTVDCMKSGIYWSSSSFVSRMSEDLKRTLGKDAKCIITGGYAPFIYKSLDKNAFIYDENLVLKGLYEIYLKNN